MKTKKDHVYDLDESDKRIKMMEVTNIFIKKSITRTRKEIKSHSKLSIDDKKTLAILIQLEKKNQLAAKELLDLKRSNKQTRKLFK